MLIVLPSDSTTIKASAWLKGRGVNHRMIRIPDSLGYRTTATIALYLPDATHTDAKTMMMDFSAEGFVIMRIFQDFHLDEDGTNGNPP